jgi:hypothetical protein
VGAWGHGNFDSDDACDYVCGVCNDIADEVDRYLADPNLDVVTVDEEVMPRIALLGVIAQGTQAWFPVAEQAARWGRLVLGICDAEDGGLEDMGWTDTAERRREIGEAIAVLVRLAHDWPTDRPE